ncbi:MAG: hypothetical protein ABH950_06220 [Candidatus Altiarchaeota archaeon]
MNAANNSGGISRRINAFPLASAEQQRIVAQLSKTKPMKGLDSERLADKINEVAPILNLSEERFIEATFRAAARLGRAESVRAQGSPGKTTEIAVSTLDWLVRNKNWGTDFFQHQAPTVLNLMANAIEGGPDDGKRSLEDIKAGMSGEKSITRFLYSCKGFYPSLEKKIVLLFGDKLSDFIPNQTTDDLASRVKTIGLNSMAVDGVDADYNPGYISEAVCDTLGEIGSKEDRFLVLDSLRLASYSLDRMSDNLNIVRAHKTDPREAAKLVQERAFSNIIDIVADNRDEILAEGDLSPETYKAVMNGAYNLSEKQRDRLRLLILNSAISLDTDSGARMLAFMYMTALVDPNDKKKLPRRVQRELDALALINSSFNAGIKQDFPSNEVRVKYQNTIPKALIGAGSEDILKIAARLQTINEGSYPESELIPRLGVSLDSSAQDVLTSSTRRFAHEYPDVFWGGGFRDIFFDRYALRDEPPLAQRLGETDRKKVESSLARINPPAKTRADYLFHVGEMVRGKVPGRAINILDDITDAEGLMKANTDLDRIRLLSHTILALDDVINPAEQKRLTTRLGKVFKAEKIGKIHSQSIERIIKLGGLESAGGAEARIMIKDLLHMSLISIDEGDQSYREAANLVFNYGVVSSNFLILKKQFLDVDPESPDFASHVREFPDYVAQLLDANKNVLDNKEYTRVQRSLKRETEPRILCQRHLIYAQQAQSSLEDHFAPFLNRTAQLVDIDEDASRGYFKTFTPSLFRLNWAGKEVGTSKGRFTDPGISEQIYGLVCDWAKDGEKKRLLGGLFEAYQDRHLMPLLANTSALSKIGGNPVLADRLSGLSQRQRIKMASRVFDGESVDLILDELGRGEVMAEDDLFTEKLKVKFRSIFTTKPPELVQAIRRADGSLDQTGPRVLMDEQYVTKRLETIALKGLGQGWSGDFKLIASLVMDQIQQHIPDPMSRPGIVKSIHDALVKDDEPLLDVLNDLASKEGIFRKLDSGRRPARSRASLLNLDVSSVVLAEIPWNTPTKETERQLREIGDAIRVIPKTEKTLLPALKNIFCIVGGGMPQRFNANKLISHVEETQEIPHLLCVDNMREFQANVRNITNQRTDKGLAEAIQRTAGNRETDSGLRGLFLQYASRVKIKGRSPVELPVSGPIIKTLSEEIAKADEFEVQIQKKVEARDNLCVTNQGNWNKIIDGDQEIVDDIKTLIPSERGDKDLIAGLRELRKKISSAQVFVSERNAEGHMLEEVELLDQAANIRAVKEGEVGLSKRDRFQQDEISQTRDNLKMLLEGGIWGISRNHMPRFIDRIIEVSEIDPGLAVKYWDTATQVLETEPFDSFDNMLITDEKNSKKAFDAVTKLAATSPELAENYLTSLTHLIVNPDEKEIKRLSDDHLFDPAFTDACVKLWVQDPGAMAAFTSLFAKPSYQSNLLKAFGEFVTNPKILHDLAGIEGNPSAS